MRYLGVFMRSMEDGSLVLRGTKDKSLAGRLEHCNWSILKPVILSLTRYQSLFLLGLFIVFPWNISLLILSRTCSLLVFSESTVFISLLQTLSKLARLCCFLKLLIIAKTLSTRMKSSEFVAILTVSKLLLFQVKSFVLFIDYGHVVVM